MELLVMTDSLRRTYGYIPINLVCPYVPYARQDRVCAPGESLSLKVFADLINAQKYDSVEVWDIHSEVAMALLDRSYNVRQESFVKGIRNLPKRTVIVSPDAGALKKINAVSKVLGLDVLNADKKRDVDTGEITGTVLHINGRLSDEPCLIVDDICDGGRTFIELAKELKRNGSGSVSLYVTHGIFSKGFNVFDDLIDKIYCPNVFGDVSDWKLERI
jgi:ribose-phosphate pyrophosphokinase